MQTHLSQFLAILLLPAVATAALGADQVYQEPDAFIANTFEGHPPKPSALFLKGETKQTVKKILGHRYRKIRIRYWLRDGRSAWILEEIGKERPITTGFVINKDGAIERTKVLVFRESRGWEVRHDFFTDQFVDARLNQRMYLDQHIDNISGATLSVRAVKKLSRVALYLHEVVTTPDA